MPEDTFLKGTKLFREYQDKIQCLLCERRCALKEGQSGVCRTRKAEGERIYTLIYGRISALEMRPIEIKPFHHFYPGSRALTYSSFGCNFMCPWCQNWSLSRAKPAGGRYISPQTMVEIALKEKADGICVSFNEPTLLHEYNLEVFKLARERGLYNTYVSNGYMTEEAAYELIGAGLDAINIDIKGGSDVYMKIEKGCREEVIWRNAKLFLENGVHVEMIYLVVTGVNDDTKTVESVLEKHLRYLGEELPIHINRYYPAYKYNAPPTPVRTLESIAEFYKNKGLKYVYIGNVPFHPLNHTYCPKCSALLIKRDGYTARISENFDAMKGQCKKCGTKIWGRFKQVDRERSEDL